MRRIEQRDCYNGDCGIACLAMVTGISYIEAKQVFFECGLIKSCGSCFTRHKDLIKALKEKDFGCKRQNFISWRKVDDIAIVKVNLRAGNWWHWVVHGHDHLGQFVYDPKPGKTGRIRDFRGLRGCGQYLML